MGPCLTIQLCTLGSCFGGCSWGRVRFGRLFFRCQRLGLKIQIQMLMSVLLSKLVTSCRSRHRRYSNSGIVMALKWTTSVCAYCHLALHCAMSGLSQPDCGRCQNIPHVQRKAAPSQWLLEAGVGVMVVVLCLPMELMHSRGPSGLFKADRHLSASAQFPMQLGSLLLISRWVVFQPRHLTCFHSMTDGWSLLCEACAESLSLQLRHHSNHGGESRIAKVRKAAIQSLCGSKCGT
mmetsp:Transcript_5293/g.9013  ORF Transcript_5293/g.9013 Transcript_5293/m.9013 type:complete len:235 (+) Transcript_5293:769-1473(+)